MENELISVIVPIYNVDKYLKRCLDSIINQTYKNLEIILIDDGSTDKSGQICDNYKRKDNRIVVIHKENGGLSSARNKGLDIAKGDLISFIDSDDYLELNMFEELINDMNKNDSDISICNYYYVKNDNKKIMKSLFNKDDFCIFGKEKYYYLLNEYSLVFMYAWNKLYKKNIFDNIRFPKGKIYEYTNIICDILDQANKVSYTSKPLYNYVYRNTSIGNSFNINHFDKIISNNKKISFFNKHGYSDLELVEKNNKMNNLISNLAKMKKYKIKNKEVFNKYYKELLDTNKDIKWKGANKKFKLFKIFRRLSISTLALWYKIKDLKNK